MNVLVVDDSKAIFKMVSLMLEESGHKGIWAEDGKKAIEILAQNKNLDLILLDWNMPNMNGLDFLEKNHKEVFTKVPIIMMTTENSTEKIQKALSLNVAEYMMKPFPKDILLNKISMVQMML